MKLIAINFNFACTHLGLIADVSLQVSPEFDSFCIPINRALALACCVGTTMTRRGLLLVSLANGINDSKAISHTASLDPAGISAIGPFR